MRLALDRSARRFDGGRVLVAGSPLTFFRLSRAGQRVVDDIERGLEVDVSSARSLVERLTDTGAAHPLPIASSSYALDDVTAVVPVRDHDPSATIAAIGPVARVIIVDDASKARIALERAASAATAPEVRVLRQDTNLGPGGARMTGLAEVTTPLVVFVDADCVPEPGWLDALLGHLDDEQVAAAAPRVRAGVLGEDPRPDAGPSTVDMYEALRSPLDLGPEPARVAPGTRVSYVPATALLMRTDAVRAVGGFDATLRTGEDVDLVWRLVEAGRRIRYEPRSVVWHRPRGSVRALLGQRAGYGRSAAPLDRRHPGAVAPAVMGGWAAAGWALIAVGDPSAGLIAGAVPAVALARTLPDVPGRDRLIASLTVLGFVRAGEQLASAVTRVWWPAALAASVVVPRLRRPLVVAAVLPGLLDWFRTKPPRRPGLLRYLGLRLLDDAAYGAGVWAGVWTERDIGPLLPRFSARRPRTANARPSAARASRS